MKKIFLLFGIIVIFSNANAETCNNCLDCTAKILNGSIELDNDITITNISELYNGTCIFVNTDNRTIDCKGHTIKSDIGYYAIYINNANNITLKNCVIKNTERAICIDSSKNLSIYNNTLINDNKTGIGIGTSYIMNSYIKDSKIYNNTISNFYIGIWEILLQIGKITYENANNVIENNSIVNCSYGIEIWNTKNNTFRNNKIVHSEYGFSIFTSINNTYSNNYVCESENFDFYTPTDYEPVIYNGINNTCNITNNFNDLNTTGCTYKCLKFYKDFDNDGNLINQNFTCQCNSCQDCIEKLNSNCSIIKLQNDIQSSGTCINNPENFTNKIFDCQGHLIKGNEATNSDGILLIGKTNNTIKNCKISNFWSGISLFWSSENTIINNTITQNKLSGISLYSISNNNYIYKNKIFSTNDGISIYFSFNNSLIDNNLTKNNRGIFLYNSKNNNINLNRVCENNKDIEITAQSEENKGNNICDKITDNSIYKNLATCNNNCSYVPIEPLFVYFCDNDSDGYFSKSISGWCFGNNCYGNCKLERGNDCNDFNNSINPLGIEIECNGIDEDCSGRDKCSKELYSSDKNGNEKNTYYSYENVYVYGSGFESNKTIKIYIIPDKSIKENTEINDSIKQVEVVTDSDGKFLTLLWNLPSWKELSYLHYDIIADENNDGKYNLGEMIDGLNNVGFSVDPIWAADKYGNQKEIFYDKEEVYVNGKGLPISNKNISLIVIPDIDLPIGTKLCNNNKNFNIALKSVEVDGNGNLKSIVNIGYLQEGYYDIIPDMNNDCILDENEKKAMDDNVFTGFLVENFNRKNLCLQYFDKEIDIFDVVYALEYLNGDKSKIPCIENLTLLDVLNLIEKI